MIATDLSLDALAIARGNVARHAHASAPTVELRHGSLLGPVTEHGLRAVVSNPPYIAYAEAGTLPPAVRDWEPPLALASGHDGMAATAGIVSGGTRILVSGGLLALEVDERRASMVAELVMGNGGYTGVSVRLDLAGRERFVFASRI